MSIAQTAMDALPPADQAPADQAPADQADEDARHCRRVLMDLMDMAHGVARVMHRHVTAPAEAAAQAAPASEPPVPAIPPLAAAASFDRASRNIRQTVILVGQVGRPKTPAARPGLHRIAARKRIIREVEDVIQRTAHGPRAERLYAELAERLDAPDLEEELDTRQVAEIVTDLCRDLGLAHTEGNHPWKRRTPADIAALRALAVRPPGAASCASPIRPGDGENGGDPAGGPSGSRPPDRPTGGGIGGSLRSDPPSGASAGAVVVPDFRAAEFRAAAFGDRALHDDEWDCEAQGNDRSGDAERRAPALPEADLSDERREDFCDYQPHARRWGAADPLIPGTANPEITRPIGRASFRGG
jgi:hypothetical protein